MGVFGTMAWPPRGLHPAVHKTRSVFSVEVFSVLTVERPQMLGDRSQLPGLILFNLILRGSKHAL